VEWETKGAWSTGDYTGVTETRSTRLIGIHWKSLENNMKLQPIRKEKLPGRNDKCPCGSGKKAKKCCLEKLKAFAALPPAVREQVVVAKIFSRLPRSEPLLPASVDITGPLESREIIVNAPLDQPHDAAW